MVIQQETASAPSVAAGAPRVFVSYAWEDDSYRNWVKRLATRLRQDGINARLDAWHCRSQTIPEFMNSEARAADKVLIVCSPKYREKVHAMEDGERMTGSGWEAMLVGAALFAGLAERTKIAVCLARGEWTAAAPDFLVGLPYFDLSAPERFEDQYLELLRALHGRQEQAPAVGTPPVDLQPARLEPLTGTGPTAEGAPPALTAYRQSLLRDLSQRYQIDTRFVRLKLLDMVRSEHSLQFKEQTEEYTELREVLADIPERAMVLLGAPGCGKSTLLRRLQLDDAQDRLADGGDRVSLFVSLGAYPLDKDPAKDAPRPLDWLKAQWRRQAPDLPDLEALLREERMLLLLDALNEMPHRDASDFRERVEKWRCFLRDDFPPGNRAVFSCRSLDYSETLSVKDDLDVRQVRVQPLTPEQIEEFLHLYAADHAADAWDEIRDDRRLLDLYGTPYFLKLLTDQLEYDPRVANERAALFTGFVRRALEREIAGRHPLFMHDGVLEARDRERINQRTWADAHDLPARGPLIPRLAALAYAMQEQERLAGSDGKQVMIALDDALALLAHPRAADLLKAGEQLAVLDEERRTDQVRFFHQLLQEYFAARQLRQQPVEAARLAASEWRADRIKPSLADKLATLQDFEPLPLPDPTGWEETAILAASMAADPDAFAIGLVDANLTLAGRCAATLRATKRAKPTTVAELQRRLVERSRDPAADLRARIAAAHALGELGDPRFERRRAPEGEYLLPPLVSIDAGTYPIGSDEGLYDNEAPAHEVILAAFAIGRFPVTNAEWRCFMEAGGYEDERWWETEAAKRWRRGEGTAEGPKQQWRGVRQSLQANPQLIQQLLADGRITSTQAEDLKRYRRISDGEFETMLENWYPPGRQTEPALWNDPAFNQPAQPVVGICWHEARAYCAWASAQTGQMYRLPTEVEWEAAARGHDGRTYPWPGDFDSARCNTFESHIRGTTPVGVFPGGDTPEGLSEMAGNVWEWTSTAYHPYPYAADARREDPDAPDVRRVLRGGSGPTLETARVARPATTTLRTTVAPSSASGSCVSPPSVEPLITEISGHWLSASLFFCHAAKRRSFFFGGGAQRPRAKKSGPAFPCIGLVEAGYCLRRRKPVGRPGTFGRVLRGGSWNNNRDNARCAYRNHNHPDNRNNNIGFRVVCVSHIEQAF